MELYPILLLLFPALAWAQNLYTPPGYSGNRYSFPGGGRQRRPPGYRPVYTHLFPGAQYNNDCGNEHLTCVEKEDCVKKVATTGQTDGQQCPPFFMFDEKLGYCATVDLLPKNNLDAVQACESQGARLLHFENSAEFKQIGKMKENKETFFFGDDAYWLDAYYDDKSETWITRTTREPIIWEQIFTQYDPVAGMTTNLEVVRKIDTEKRCLTVKFNDKHPELLELASIKCEDDKSEIACKLGFYTNKCQENKKNVCCFSPSSDFYLKNTHSGPGSAIGEADANCFLEIIQGTTTVIEPCEKVLATLAPSTAANKDFKVPFRVGSSFFYVDKDECIGKGKRKAVISDRKVHEFISRYAVMANLEAAGTYDSLIIGLQYKGPIHKLIWENGRTYDYYNETFWNGLVPNFDKFGDSGKPVCGNYVVSPIEYEYKWELSDVCTPAAKTPAVCELPIRFTDLMPTAKKISCGMRHRRGVLARSAYASGHELQALYGEFPWQAAIYKVRHHAGLVSTFVCSGVLIDKEFVLTPAHCVVGPSKAFTIVLGEYTVGGGGSILERQVAGVSDILVYPGYESTNPLVHDIALVQLDRAIVFGNYPQIGLACLPYPDILYRNTGAWDCFTVGWNGKAGALQRVESDLLAKRECRVYTRSYYEYGNYIRKPHYGYGSTGYDKVHGHHLVTYQKHNYFSGSTPDLLCTKSFETKACVDDPAAVLVCRHAALHEDSFFGFGNRGYSYPGHRKTNARIVNAYGKNRFDSEKWYVMGLSHSLSPCAGNSKGNYARGYSSHRKDIGVFTPVHEYLPFIHAHLDAKITSDSKS